MSEAPPPPPPFVPVGSEAVLRWASARRVGYEARPSQEWFRAWEPFHEMVSPAAYYNACSWPAAPGSVTLVEPYTEDEDSGIEPIDRTVIGFVSHPGLAGLASLRVGEHFITRSTILTDPPPPLVELGDPLWDQHVVTRSPSPAHARATLTTALRRLLARWGFTGHIELRPGAAIVHYAGFQPTPEGYESLSRAIPQIVTAALTPG